MDDALAPSYTAFDGPRRLVSGLPGQVGLYVKGFLDRHPEASVLTFDDRTGRVVDLDLRGTPAEIQGRYEEGAPRARGVGRPRLGVVPREVTLLPRHWEWLNSRPGGASVALRKLVEEARRSPRERRREAQERTYRVMAALAGDAPGFEEALRALYAGNPEAFRIRVDAWPGDVRAYVLEQALPAFQACPLEVDHD